jgi:hypothetical protein
MKYEYDQIIHKNDQMKLEYDQIKLLNDQMKLQYDQMKLEFDQMQHQIATNYQKNLEEINNQIDVLTDEEIDDETNDFLK